MLDDGYFVHTESSTTLNLMTDKAWKKHPRLAEMFDDMPEILGEEIFFARGISGFGWHIDAFHTSTYSYNIMGGEKIWYIIPFR